MASDPKLVLTPANHRELRDRLRQHLEDALRRRSDAGNDDDGDSLHYQSSEIDSQDILSASEIFHEILGIDVDETLLEGKEYSSVDDVLDHFIPIMVEEARRQGTLE